MPDNSSYSQQVAIVYQPFVLFLSSEAEASTITRIISTKPISELRTILTDWELFKSTVESLRDQ